MAESGYGCLCIGRPESLLPYQDPYRVSASQHVSPASGTANKRRHYQLRHFISCPEPDLLYYASGAAVYCLNAATRTQAHVTTLPWEARCTASGHGYVCVGGEENGNFAAIKVAGFPPTDPSDVDASLPIDLEHRLPRPPRPPRPPLLGTASRIRLEKIGTDIVNSISIHKLPANDPDQEDDIVAVLTNNDKTVRVYSLTQNLELAVLDLPFAMNHATISPDGQMLVAVGDAPVAYFFQRTKSQKSGSKPHETWILSTPPEWELLQHVTLYRPANSHADGYFTTAWSPAGRLCAVGSECGYITVFHVELLKTVEYGEDAILQLISSTRPDTRTGPGAVRTMHFSPAPWDFLIWSEDQGRVCIADLRAGLKVKQVLTLDAQEEGLEKVEIADFDLTLSPEMHELRREADFIRRYRRALDSEGTAAAVDAANEYLEADSERQRLHRRLGVVESDNDPLGLTARERQVLSALRTSQGIMPRSINYTTSRHIDTPLEPTARDVADVMAQFMTEGTIQNHSHRWLQERTTPRRQASVIVSINEGTVNAPAMVANITDTAITRSPNPVPAHARRVPTNEMIATTDVAWRTVEEALAVEQARAANRSTALIDGNPTAPELRSELRRIRQLTQARERLRNTRAGQPMTESYEFSLGLRRSSRTHDARLGARTAGLAMSQDGKTLYCGTEEGIFEFKMNLHVRKEFPAITPR
ncbi:WD domain containing [Pyrenophora seminiperda CCB06]|uniref:WD domain containing n=1 Tax=Pyrenophora seminiperda CCB06 TaxID=1302712 RepID=A0A3M7MG46_9PLEO|nr:WD domain containing [Pyrenophora seminiperda CCB06]